MKFHKHKKTIPLLLATILSCVPVFSAYAQIEKLPFENIPRQESDLIADDQIIVKYKSDKINLKENAGRKKIQTLEKNANVKSLDKIEKRNLKLIQTQNGLEETLQKFRKDPNVEYAEPNYKRLPTAQTINDPAFYLQWNLVKTNVPLAWDMQLESDTQAVVANIDTGIEYNHEDLFGNLWDGSASCRDHLGQEIAGGCPNHGWDFKDSDNDPYDESWINEETQEKIDGHGTVTAGIIGATSNNGVGLGNFSNHNKLKVMSIRFGFDTFSEIKAISFARENGAHVINASFGSSTYSQAEKDAICSFDGIFVTAAGNDGTDNDAVPQYPANHDCSNIITVAATDSNDALTEFSNYGATTVDIAAPGDSVPTTHNASVSSYAYVSGTSISTPAVSALAALIFSRDSNLTITENINLIKNYGQTLPNSSEAAKIQTGKRIDVFSTISQIANETVPPTAPTNLSIL